MKKLMIIPIAMFTCAVFSGSALADEPTPSALDRHAVWSGILDKRGDTPTESHGFMGVKPGQDNKSARETMSKSDMTGAPADFNFIRETETYDYAKDRDGSA